MQHPAWINWNMLTWSRMTMIIVCVGVMPLAAQQLDKIKEQDPFAMSGGITLGSSFNHSTSAFRSQAPFGYFISANTTLSVYGISVPFNVTYHDQKGSISNPFQRFSMAPSYKWATLGVGNVSVSLSPYTLSGQYFKGAYLKLTPGKFRFTGAFGRLENPLAQLDTIVSGSYLIPTYRRTAMAASIGYGGKPGFIDLIIFRAKDNISEQGSALIDRSLVKPEENIVVGLSGGVKLFEVISLKANAAASAHTANQESTIGFGDLQNEQSLNVLNNVLKLNLSTRLQFAGDAGIYARWQRFGIGIEYKRIDPFYKSLGTYYFQEDIQNITLLLNFSLWQNKVRFTGRGGIQQNNLSKLRAFTNKRTIFNGSMTVAPSQSFMTSVRVSNYQSDRTPHLSTLNDSLRFTQTNESYSITPVYTIRQGEKAHVISSMLSYQKLTDLGLLLNTSRGGNNLSGHLNYNLANKQKNLTTGISLLYNKNVFSQTANSRFGGNATMRKTLLQNKLSMGMSAGYLNNHVNETPDGYTVNASFNTSYQIQKSLQCGFSLTMVNRQSKISDYREIRGNARISYQFSAFQKNKIK